MGKKKVKVPAVVPQSPFDEAVDILATILEECGVWKSSSGGEDDWDRLSSVLQAFVAAIESSQKASLHEDSSEQEQDDILLDVEQAAQSLHSSCESFGAYIQNRSELIDLCQDLDSFCDGCQDSIRIRIVSRALMGAIRQQTFTAIDAVKSILQTLSHLHMPEASSRQQYSSLSTQVHHFLTLIQRRCIDPKSPPWTEAVELLKQIQPDHQSLDFLERFGLSKGRTPEDESIGKTLEDSSRPTELLKKESPTVVGAVRDFLTLEGNLRFTKPSLLLVVGPEGSGKTYLCNEIQGLVGSNACVIRPSLPLDTMGKSVGSTEDNLISLFSFAISRMKRCVLLLDDIENVCGHEYDGPTGAASQNGTSKSAGEPHQLARARSTLLSALEFLHLMGQGNELLVICTSRYNINDSIDRFDKVYTLTPPDISNRRRVISSNLGLISPFGEDSLTFPDVEIESLLSGIVDCTVGMSYAELSQYCRQAIEATKVSDGDEHDSVFSSHAKILQGLKQSLQASLPDSLRSGVNDDFVDLTVMTARDLLNMSSGSTSGTLMQLPLLGHGAENAWEELRRLIVMPLCQAKALDKLLYQHGGSGRKVFCGGVLLTGDPGCGKSAMAYHCASVAASLVPSVKLIDVSCTSLIHKEVGGSERSIHRLFECARAAAPCILLMDGIENVAAVRGNDNTTEGTMDRVLSTLLTELDGVDNDNFSQDKAGGIAIIGITHNINWIDAALRRPGRLEKIIELGRPELEARRAIILKEIHKTPSIQSDELKTASQLEDLAQFVAEQTQSLTGAAVIAVCDEAKMQCVRGQLDIPSTDTQLLALTRNHFIAAIQTQWSGQNKTS